MSAIDVSGRASEPSLDDLPISAKLGPIDPITFRTVGYMQLPNLWSASTSESLAREAAELRAHAVLPEEGPRTPLAPNRRPSRQTPAATGPVLSRLHHRLLGTARALSGRLLVPTFCAYGYYEMDDEVLLHVDLPDSEMALVTTALGDVGPLHVHPELRGSTIDDLGALESDPGWDRSSGVRLPYPRFGVTALLGTEMPHHRPGNPLEGLNAVAAMFYRSVFDPPASDDPQLKG